MIALSAGHAAGAGRSQPARDGAAQPRGQRARRHARAAARSRIDAREEDARAPNALGLAAGRYAVLSVTDTRRGHGRGDAAARDRAVLHDQGRRQGHRPRPVDGARPGRAVGRTPRPRRASRARARRPSCGCRHAAGAGRGRRRSPARAATAAIARRSPSWRSTTMRWCCTNTAAMLEDHGHRVTMAYSGERGARASCSAADVRPADHRSGHARHDRRRADRGMSAPTSPTCRSCWRPAMPNCRRAWRPSVPRIAKPFLQNHLLDVVTRAVAP